MAYSAHDIEAVWQKGTVIPGSDPALWRADRCGAPMRKSDYGDRNSKYGWEVDHINPHGPDTLSNWQPMQWENNVAKSDGNQQCVVTG